MILSPGRQTRSSELVDLALDTGDQPTARPGTTRRYTTNIRGLGRTGLLLSAVLRPSVDPALGPVSLHKHSSPPCAATSASAASRATQALCYQHAGATTDHDRRSPGTSSSRSDLGTSLRWREVARRSRVAARRLACRSPPSGCSQDRRPCGGHCGKCAMSLGEISRLMHPRSRLVGALPGRAH